MPFYKSLLLFCFCVPLILKAQQSDDFRLVVSDLSAGETVQTFDLREYKTKGLSFFNENWLFGHLIFDDGSVSKKDLLLKYDLLNQTLIVSLNGSAFVVPTENITGFVLKNNIISSGQLTSAVFSFEKIKNIADKVILEQVIEGSFKMYTFHGVDELKPNYIPALDAGSLHTKIIKKNTYYLWVEGVFLKIPARRKQAKNFFSKYTRARQYMKQHKMKQKSEKYLIELISFMNQ